MAYNEDTTMHGLLREILNELRIMNKRQTEIDERMMRGSRQAWATPNNTPTPTTVTQPPAPQHKNEPNIPDRFNFTDHMPTESKL